MVWFILIASFVTADLLILLMVSASVRRWDREHEHASDIANLTRRMDDVVSRLATLECGAVTTRSRPARRRWR